MNILLLRGLARQKKHWGEFVPLLKQTTGANIECLDLPGVGDQSHQLYPLTINAIMNNIKKRWSPNNKLAPSCIIGHSLGGMVAMEWLRKHPEDFNTGIFLNTSASNASYVWERLNWKNLPLMLKIIREKNIKNREGLIFDLIKSAPQNKLQIVESWSEINQQSPVTYGLFLNQLIAASLFKSPKKLSQRLLFLNSAGDKMVAPKCSQNLAKKYGAQLITHDWAGHDLAHDDPAWVTQQIADFLSTTTEEVVPGH